MSEDRLYVHGGLYQDDNHHPYRCRVDANQDVSWVDVMTGRSVPFHHPRPPMRVLQMPSEPAPEEEDKPDAQERIATALETIAASQGVLAWIALEDYSTGQADWKVAEKAAMRTRLRDAGVDFRP